MTPEEALTLKSAAKWVPLLDPLNQVAAQHGYALAWHGSFTRDLDVVACPWEQHVSEPEVLVLALMDAVGGYLHPADIDAGHCPSSRYHGRLSWPIHIAAGYYIDLSVMPKGVVPQGAVVVP